ncbi:MAG TPA: restriction endonuclease subunit S [Gammaproteobacteria bacterium]|nr:restriction endonuclease subunit S [Gammaproteobacteria bacterium]
MKQSWEERRLKDIGITQTGTTPKTAEKNNYGDFIPFIKPANIDIYNDGKVRYDNDGLSEKGLRAGRKMVEGSILMVCIGATIGKVGYVDRDVSCNQQVNSLSVSKEFFPKFFYYALSTPSFYQQVMKNSAQATLPIINKKKWECLTVKYPKSLPEQQRIVAILDEAFAAIANAKANAEQNLQNAKELFESYLQRVFENKDADWEEKKLIEVCELNPRKKEARDKLKETDYVTFLPMEDLGVLNKEIHGVKERQLKDVAGSYTYFSENDVLLAKITPCFENGKIGIGRNLINGVGFGSSEYIVFRTKGNIKPEFLYYFLSRNQIRDEGKKYMSGAVGHKRVSKEWIENYRIPFPKSLKAQRAITQKLDYLSLEIKKLKVVYQSKIRNLEELKKSILQKAFSGELTKTEVVAS